MEPQLSLEFSTPAEQQGKDKFLRSVFDTYLLCLQKTDT